MFVNVYLNNFLLFKNYVVPIIKLREQTKIGHVSRNSIASKIATISQKISSIKVKKIEIIKQNLFSKRNI